MSHILRYDEDGKLSTEQHTVVLHPSPNDLRDEIVELFRFSPGAIPQVEIVEIHSGALFRQEIAPETRTYGIESPEAFPYDQDQLFFLGNGAFLNEFGYYYVGLYVLGMVTRYYPHFWIKEADRNAVITLLADEFVEASLVRAPLLLLGQLNQTIYVYSR